MRASPKPEPLSPGRRPEIAAVIAALVVYLLCITILLLVLNWIFGSLSRDNFGGAALLWGTYLFPSLIAPAAGAIIAGILYGESGRRAAYWPNFALIVLFTLVAILWLLIAGGAWNTVLAFVQFGGGIIAWVLLYRVARSPRLRGR